MTDFCCQERSTLKTEELAMVMSIYIIICINMRYILNTHP
jgi:hypothetical protein